MGLATPSSTPTLVAARKVTLAVDPGLFDFTLCDDVEGYINKDLDSDSDSASSVATAIFAVGGEEGRQGH